MKNNNTYRTEWNLKLLYKDINDPKIEKDVVTIENVCLKLEKKYRNSDFTKTPALLAKALDEKEKINSRLESIDPLYYFGRLIDSDSRNHKAHAMQTKIEERLTIASNRLEFFHLRIAAIPPSLQKKFLKAPVLSKYSYLLEGIFKAAKYNLSEKEEQLTSLLSQTSYGLWVDSQEKLLNKQTIKHGKKLLTIPQAQSILPDLGKKDRQILHKKVIESLKSISHFAEAEMNAVINFKKVMDKRRGLRNPYSATVLSYDNDEKEVETLVNLITKKFSVSHRFFKLHAKLMGEKQITLPDRSVPIGKIKKKFNFDASSATVREALLDVNSSYVEIFDSYLKNGQIDVYPRKGKHGGGYCAKSGSLPTFILLTHTDDLRSVETLGHEMGHAIHGELSKSQPPRYRGFSTSTAEVASTFFEQVTQSVIEKSLTDKEKVVFLHNKIMGDIATIFRQIACFNFEKELHERIRSEGQLSAGQISSLLSKHLRSYLGSSVKVEDDDGYGFVSWSHIRYFFYVYSYAYGQIISKSLFEMWQHDKKFAIKIEKFLRAGRSMSPKNIFKSIGIDVSKPGFFEAGLKSIERDIDKLDRLTKRSKVT